MKFYFRMARGQLFKVALRYAIEPSSPVIIGKEQIKIKWVR